MNRFSILGAIWSLTFVLSPALQAAKDMNSIDTTAKLRQIVSVLRILWGPDFDSRYRKYVVGSPAIVSLVPRTEMIRIADARLDGRLRDGAETQGLMIGTEFGPRIFVVYDDVAPLLVAETIDHEIGHMELLGSGLSRNEEEARVRKIVDTRFFEKVFGKEWMHTTVAALDKTVSPVEKNGRLYRGYTPVAIATLYRQLRKAGAKMENTPLHDRILAHVVFILTNSEENILAALDADDVP
jgi:hypothetical protein